MVDGDEHVDALGPTGLHPALQPRVGQRLADQVGRSHGHREAGGVGWVEVEHEVGGAVGLVGPTQCRVILDRPLVGEPQQRAAVVAQGVRHLALGRLRPELHGAHPCRRVLRDVLLHERLLAPVYPDDRQRPILQLGQDQLAHAVQILHQVSFRRPGALEQRLVEVGELDGVAFRRAAGTAHLRNASDEERRGSRLPTSDRPRPGEDGATARK